MRLAPRPQFQVSHAPMSFGALPTPSNWYARAGRSLFSPLPLVSTPVVIDTGRAVRQMKIGATLMPQGAWMTAATLPECRASVRELGPFTRGSSYSRVASCRLFWLSSSPAVPIVLVASWSV